MGDLGDEVVLAADVGSSSVRASLCDGSGNVVRGTETTLDYALDLTRDGGATKRAEELFGLFVRAVDGTLENDAQRGNDISGVAVSTFWHALLEVDGDGAPTTPIFTWADRRAASYAGQLRERLDPDSLHCRTGCVPHSSYQPAKLLWLASEAPETFSWTQRWISPGEYFYLRLFGGGDLRVGVSMAPTTGLMHQNRKVWDDETLAALPISEAQFPPISEATHEVLSPEWARRWPTLAKISWFPAAGDGACSNVGVGSTTSDTAALMVGTSGAMRVL